MPSGRSSPWPRILLSAARFSNLALRLLTTARYDIIHCQFGTAAFDISLLKRLGLLRAPVVCSFRGHDISGVVQREGPGVYDSVFPQLARALPNCRTFAARLEDLGCEPHKIEILPSALRLGEYRYTEPLLPRPGEPIELCFTGRLVERKGVDDAIRALRILKKSYAGARLSILGDGPERPRLESLSRELGLQDSVRFLGAGTWIDVIDLLKRSHLFVAPFRTPPGGNQDAPSNVLKEAMAVGLPVVSTRHGGVPELVKHEVNGLLAGEGNPTEVSKLLTRLLEQPERWKEFTQNGRKFVEEFYDSDKIYDAQLDMYQRVARGE
jgi:colanic acid/amylovoran biosynthesis glycosyltransferase